MGRQERHSDGETGETWGDRRVMERQGDRRDTVMGRQERHSDGETGRQERHSDGETGET